MDMDIGDEGWGTSRVFKRRASLAYSKSLGTRNCFQNRSLQDFSGRLRMNMDNELEIPSRKQSVFLSDEGGSEKEALNVSTDSVRSDNSNEEWRQVSGCCSHRQEGNPSGRLNERSQKSDRVPESTRAKKLSKL